MADESETQVEDAAETKEESAAVPVQAPIQQSELGQITARQPVVLESDEMDKRFDTARQTISSDDMLSPSEKAMKLIELDVMQEKRRTERQDSATNSEERIRNGFASQYGVDRPTVDSTWNEAVGESVRRRGRFDYGTAMTIFEDRMSGKKKSEPTPIADKRPVGQTRTEPRGARQAPATPEKKMTVEQIMQAAAAGDYSQIPKEVLEEAKR